MTPTAFAGETTRWFHPDSMDARASASLGSTPCRRAVATMMAWVSVRVGSDRLASVARLRAAASATARGYCTPLNVSGTAGFRLAVAGRPGMVSR